MRIDNPSISGSLSFIGGTNTITATSVSLTGSLSGTFEGSFSSTATANISGAFDSVSSSLATRIASNEGSVSSLNSASSSYLLNTTDTLVGDLTVTGTITAQEFHTEFVSASILYDSGSTKFGNSIDDKHSMTGSLQVSGSSHYVLGNIGIGTDSPSKPLHVQGEGMVINNFYVSGSSGKVILGNADGTQSTSEIKSYHNLEIISGLATGENGLIYIKPNNTYAAVFTGAGNSIFYNSVGIGTTLSSPESKLSVKGSSGTADLFSISDITVPTSGTEYGVGMIKTNSTEYALNITSYNANGKGLRIYNNGGQNAFLVSQAGGDRFVIDGSGNVGIGTTLPSARLTVSNTAAVTNQIDLIGHASTAKGHIGEFSNNLYISSNYYYSGGQYADTNSLGQADIVLSAGATNTSYIDFGLSDAGANNPSSKVRITSAGNVGIGTTSPDTKLHVVNSTGSQIIIENTATSLYTNMGFEGTGRSYYVGVGNDAETSLSLANKFYIYDGQGAAVRFAIDTSGNVGIGTTSPLSKLDIRGDVVIAKTTVANDSFGGPVLSLGDSTSEVGMAGGIAFTELLTEDPTNVTMGIYYDGKLNRLHITGPSDSQSSAGQNLVNASKHFTVLRDSGYVGIGNTSPAARLDVAGNIVTSTGRIASSNQVTVSALNTNYEIYDAPVAGVITVRDNTYGGSGLWLQDPNGNGGVAILVTNSWVNGTFSIRYISGRTYIQKNSGNVPVIVNVSMVGQ